MRISGLLTTAVKGLRAREVAQVELGPDGALANRRFMIVAANGRMINGKRHGDLQRVSADYDHAARTLALEFPDGTLVSGELPGGGESVEVAFYSDVVNARSVAGPWSQALSELLGEPVSLVESAEPWGAVDRGREGAVSVISRASLGRLASEGGVDSVDSRRLRMLVELDGLDAHEEDGWLGRSVRLGEALIAVRGHVGRCAVTTRHPESGERDFDTVKLLARYRRELDTTEPIACGVYGEVIEQGMLRVGDAATLL